METEIPFGALLCFGGFPGPQPFGGYQSNYFFPFPTQESQEGLNPVEVLVAQQLLPGSAAPRVTVPTGAPCAPAHEEKVDPCFRRAHVLCHSQVSLDATETVIKQMKGQGTSLLCLCLPRAELSAAPRVFSASILHQSHSRELQEGSVVVVMEQNQRVFCCLNGGQAEPSDNSIFCLLQPVLPKKRAAPSSQSLLPLPCSVLTSAFLLPRVPKRNSPSQSWDRARCDIPCSAPRGLGLTLAKMCGQTPGAEPCQGTEGKELLAGGVALPRTRSCLLLHTPRILQRGRRG